MIVTDVEFSAIGVTSVHPTVTARDLLLQLWTKCSVSCACVEVCSHKCGMCVELK
jgi:hypothetical protein